MSCSGTLPKVSTYFHVVINMIAAGYLYSLDVKELSTNKVYTAVWFIILLHTELYYLQVCIIGKYTIILLLCLFISVQLHMMRNGIIRYHHNYYNY